MRQLRVALVTGSRHYQNRARVYGALDSYQPDLVVHGGADGADAMAEQWGEEAGVARLLWPDEHWGGHVSGPTRNQYMVDVVRSLVVAGRWDHTVLAFPLPGSRGTWSCVNKAKAAGLTVQILDNPGVPLD